MASCRGVFTPNELASAFATADVTGLVDPRWDRPASFRSPRTTTGKPLALSCFGFSHHRPFAAMLSAVAVAWVGGSTACLLAASVGWLALEPSSALALAIGSGVIAAASGLPGWVQECRVGRAGQDDQRGGQGLEPQRVLLSFSSGVIIRLAGTVALLGLSSYHLPAAKETLAGIVLGWYLYLTTVEVAILATLLPRHDRRCPAEPERLSREAN